MDGWERDNVDYDVLGTSYIILVLHEGKYSRFFRRVHKLAKRIWKVMLQF